MAMLTVLFGISFYNHRCSVHTCKLLYQLGIPHLCDHFTILCVLLFNIAGMYGQLGHGNTEKQSAPKLVTSLESHTIYLLACGNFHTVSSHPANWKSFSVHPW